VLYGATLSNLLTPTGQAQDWKRLPFHEFSPLAGEPVSPTPAQLAARSEHPCRDSSLCPSTHSEISALGAEAAGSLIRVL
jgi:hypothetical protein